MIRTLFELLQYGEVSIDFWMHYMYYALYFSAIQQRDHLFDESFGCLAFRRQTCRTILKEHTSGNRQVTRQIIQLKLYLLNRSDVR